MIKVIPIVALFAVVCLAIGNSAEAADYTDFDDGIHDINMGRAWDLLNRQRQGETLTEDEAAFLKKAMDYRSAWQALETKRRNNEAMTEEENAFLDKALAVLRRGREAARARYREEHPPRDSTGMVPLTELVSAYKGQEGGLYPGGGNAPPPAHLEAGLERAQEIQPLDREGKPDPNGAIVFISIGMSNTTQEFSVFVETARKDPDLNPVVTIVDCAQGGQAANTTADPDAGFWTIAEQRLERAGVTPAQVQAAWIKQAVPGPQGDFLEEAKRLQGYLVQTINNLADRFPNLRTTYLSSRIYAGYAETGLNPEPYAYEGGFAMKWVIADQIAGKPELNYDPAKGPVRAPWLAWGPYLWADGLKPRADGLTYERADLMDDGTHPADGARRKVSERLLRFLKTDPTSKPWFTKS